MEQAVDEREHVSRSDQFADAGFTQWTPTRHWPIGYNVVIEGDRERNPLRFAGNDTLHRNQPATTTICHRQCGVNLGW